MKSSIPGYVSMKIPARDTTGTGEARGMNLILSANPSHEGL